MDTQFLKPALADCERLSAASFCQSLTHLEGHPTVSFSRHNGRSNSIILESSARLREQPQAAIERAR